MEGIDSNLFILYFSPIFQALGATKPLGARKTPNSFNPLYHRGVIEQGAHSLAKKISKNKTPLPSFLILADQAAAGESVNLYQVLRYLVNTPLPSELDPTTELLRWE